MKLLFSFCACRGARILTVIIVRIVRKKKRKASFSLHFSRFL